jgi:multidrug efflux pump subunit AcrA (membrane-fusion protein)
MHTNPHVPSGWRLSGFSCALAAIVLFSGHAGAQGFKRSKPGEKVIIESGAASQVSEKVRACAQGVVVAVFVKAGDTVTKNQVLGHMELATAKYQLDLSRHNLENNASLRAFKSLAQAWTATREETEQAVRKRQMNESRLEWASNMERYHQGNYEAQLEQKKLQRIQYEYSSQQYEARFFRAPVDGVVTEVLLDVGRKVDIATHVFSVGNDDSFMVPVEVPADLAKAVSTGSDLPVRAVNGGDVMRGLVQEILDNPKKAGGKIIRLMLRRSDFPTVSGADLAGTKFDVLLPQSGKSKT